MIHAVRNTYFNVCFFTFNNAVVISLLKSAMKMLEV